VATYYQEAEHEYTERILANPDLVAVYSDALRKLQSGYYAQSWVDIVFQKWGKFSKANLADAFAFAQIWSGLCRGAIAYTTLLIGSSPLSDQDIEGNNKIIHEALSRLSGWRDDSGTEVRDICRWHGEFQGGSQDADGYIQWEGEAVL
jgi:hypothetical protein